MNTATIDRPAAVTKSSKAKVAIVNVTDGNVHAAAPVKARKSDVILNKPKAKAAEKAELAKHAKEIEAKAAKSKPAPVKAPKEKAAPKPKAPKEPKEHRVSAMWVIRTNMAKSIATTGKPATVEAISKACNDAGVPKGEGTIKTIISDFMQSYEAMKLAGLIKAA
jgi:hypothetical protein